MLNPKPRCVHQNRAKRLHSHAVIGYPKTNYGLFLGDKTHVVNPNNSMDLVIELFAGRPRESNH